MTNFPAPEEESRIFTAVIDTLHSLDITTLENKEDFKPLRLVTKSPLVMYSAPIIA